MVNRKLAIFFLLLANLVLLAHAFIPHHHHDDIICLASSHCQSAEHGHHFCANPHHGHDSQRSTDCCSLKQTVILPAGQGKSDCRYVTTHNHHSGDFQAAILQQSCCLPLVEQNLSLRPAVPVQFYDRYQNSSLRLRAPPVA